MDSDARCLGYLSTVFQPDGCAVCLSMHSRRDDTSETYNLIFYLWYSDIPLFEELKNKTLECLVNLRRHLSQTSTERNLNLAATLFHVTNTSSTSNLLEIYKQDLTTNKNPIYIFNEQPSVSEIEALTFVLSSMNSNRVDKSESVDLEIIKKEINKYHENQKINSLLTALNCSVGESEYREKMGLVHDPQTVIENNNALWSAQHKASQRLTRVFKPRGSYHYYG